MNLYNYYNNILKEHKDDYLFLTRLEIVDNLNGMGSKTKHLTEEQKDYLISMISQYWIDEDLQESSLFDITWLAVDNHLENAGMRFYEKMDELV